MVVCFINAGCLVMKVVGFIQSFNQELSTFGLVCLKSSQGNTQLR